MSTAAELRQLLKTDGSGKDLYEHLTEVTLILFMRNVLAKQSAKGFDAYPHRKAEKCL